METLSPPAATPAFTAALNLFQAHARLEERFAAALGSVHGLSLKDTLLLMFVAHAEGGRLSRIELAKRLSVSPSTVTRTTAPLEKRGLLGRESHEHDIGKARMRAVADAEATMARLADDVFRDRWSAAEIKSLSSLLRWLVT
jgi:DNA-binding MarR family transcriptional regulator